MRTLLILLLAAYGGGASAQTGHDSRILAVIDSFFAAMTARDSSAMAAVLTRDGIFHAVAPDRPVRATSHATYLAELMKGEERLFERYWDPQIMILGSIATVTTAYDFHVDGKLSHCGTDIFTLLQEDGQWKISGGVYSLQREGCPACPLGPVDRSAAPGDGR